MKGLEGKVALVTGAGRGIGKAIAARLTAEGARVAVADVDRDTAAATAAEIGNGAIAVRMDVTDSASVRSAVAEATQRLGPIDVLVNNAGWDKVEPFVKSQEETWDRVVAINLKGPIRCARAVLDSMIERRSGKIVSIGSDAGRVGSSGEAVYSGAKAGVIGFSKTLAREVARYGINVNVVCPGPTNTPLLQEIAGGNEKLMASLRQAIPMGRTGEPEDIAGAVAFLASDDAGFITGQTLSVSGGLSMI
ncbi:MAG: 2-hydroxycyclohexanecarboxyl-CoA dehydrogenase [Candidatus Binatota bacterium]|nr:2-hydroxycyclohexanecarboxyl-CoA dehydrogenase [Candidatus Binatota bacterium]